MPDSRQDRRALRDIVQFLAVGGGATAVSLVGFNTLVHGMLVGAAPMQGQPVAAFVLVNVMAGLVAYVGLRLWAFSHREVQDSIRSVATFFAWGALTMTIPVLCLAFSRYVLGWSSPWADNVSANVIGLGLGTAARFWVFRRYVFRPAAHPVPEPSRA